MTNSNLTGLSAPSWVMTPNRPFPNRTTSLKPPALTDDKKHEVEGGDYSERQAVRYYSRPPFRHVACEGLTPHYALWHQRIRLVHAGRKSKCEVQGVGAPLHFSCELSEGVDAPGPVQNVGTLFSQVLCIV